MQNECKPGVIFLPVFIQFAKIKLLYTCKKLSYILCPDAWVSECPSTLWVLKCPSAWVAKYICAFSAGVSKCLWSALVPKGHSSAWVPWVPKCFWSGLGVSFERPSRDLRGLWVKKICNIPGNGLFYSFIDFLKNFSEYNFT